MPSYVFLCLHGTFDNDLDKMYLRIQNAYKLISDVN